jgi:hypothetical protein
LRRRIAAINDEEADMKKNMTPRRLIQIGRVSTLTRAVRVGASDEFGNYPMRWNF